MTATTSTCVDCGTPLIGSRIRCAACHDQHVVGYGEALPRADIDLTSSRPRRSAVEPTSSFAVWLVIAESFLILVLMTIFVLKGCP